MTVFNWTITKMYCNPQDGNYTNVVVSADWECVGTEGVFVTSALGSSTFPPPENSFIPYNQLSQEEVLDWCWTVGGVNKEFIEGVVQSDLDKMITPNVVSPPLPWG